MSTTFTINASPGTDVWRKPPSTDIFNAPTQTHPTTKSSAPLSSFSSARLSFRLPPVSTLAQYDQAGLLLSLQRRDSTHLSSSPLPPKWLKTGVEIYNGLPRAATVACDAWADWSLAPVSSGGDSEDGTWLTIAVESGCDELGKSLWVYQVVLGEKIPLREVCWPFGHGSASDWALKVEAYACRPNKKEGTELVVEFRDFDVQWEGLVG